MFLGKRYVQRSTGLRVKIVEIIQVQKRSHFEPRYRMNGSNDYLTARQVAALYDAITTVPAREQAA